MTTIFTSATVHLARDIYEARILAFDMHGQPAFEDLPPEALRIWIQQAQDILHANRPVETWHPSALFQAVAGVARLQAAHVIGRISPTEPYGHTD